ncbi:hypothetical protein EMIT091MI3_100070 [Kosakonia quasisacchari]
MLPFFCGVVGQLRQSFGLRYADADSQVGALQHGRAYLAPKVS